MMTVTVVRPDVVADSILDSIMESRGYELVPRDEYLPHRRRVEIGAYGGENYHVHPYRLYRLRCDGPHDPRVLTERVLYILVGRLGHDETTDLDLRTHTIVDEHIDHVPEPWEYEFDDRPGVTYTYTHYALFPRESWS
jgi:hypothetical protein